MEWIKRNLVWVIGGAIALVLIAVAGYYLFTKMQDEKAKEAAIGDFKAKLETLYQQNPYPSSENTQAAQKAQEKLQAMLKEVGRFYPLAQTNNTNPITNSKLKLKFIGITDDLRNQAQRAGVVLPTNFYFSFTRQYQLMQLATNSLETLNDQLLDVQALCEVLFKTQIPELLLLRRAPVGMDDQDQMGNIVQDYLSNRTPQTNEWSVAYPYEVVFKGLTEEVRQVLEGLAHSPRGFVVRYVKVEPFTSSAQATADTLGVGAGYPTYGMGRYGRFRGPPVDAPPFSPPPPRPSMGVVVDKQPLKVTLMVEAIRPLPEGAKVAQPVAPASDGTAAPAGSEYTRTVQPQATN
jgi:hypothetical protein